MLPRSWLSVGSRARWLLPVAALLVGLAVVAAPANASDPLADAANQVGYPLYPLTPKLRLELIGVTVGRCRSDDEKVITVRYRRGSGEIDLIESHPFACDDTQPRLEMGEGHARVHGHLHAFDILDRAACGVQCTLEDGLKGGFTATDRVDRPGTWTWIQIVSHDVGYTEFVRALRGIERS